MSRCVAITCCRLKRTRGAVPARGTRSACACARRAPRFSRVSTTLSETYTYYPRVLDQLRRHGLDPRPTTPPGRLRDAISDLYRYEISRLRGDRLAKRIRREDYAGHVVELRKRYLLLSIPVEMWTVGGEGQEG